MAKKRKRYARRKSKGDHTVGQILQVFPNQKATVEIWASKWGVLPIETVMEMTSQQFNEKRENNLPLVENKV